MTNTFGPAHYNTLKGSTLWACNFQTDPNGNHSNLIWTMTSFPMLNSLKCLQKSTSILYWAWIAWISLLVSLFKSWPCRANALADLETLAWRDIGKMSKGHIGFITMHSFIWTHAYRHSDAYGRMGKPNNLTTLEVSESPKPLFRWLLLWDHKNPFRLFMCTSYHTHSGYSQGHSLADLFEMR